LAFRLLSAGDGAPSHVRESPILTRSLEEERMSFSNGFKTQALIAPTIAMFTLFGCGTPPGDPSSPDPVAVEATAAKGTDVSALTGEQLYRGIILAEGPVADLLPELRDNMKMENFISDKGQLAEISKANDQVIETMKKLSPGFFDTFKKDIQSGDHLRIRGALESALKVTQAALSTMPGLGDVEKEGAAAQKEGKRVDSFEQLKAELATSVKDKSKAVQSHAVVATEVALAAVLHIAIAHNAIIFTIVAIVFAAFWVQDPGQSTVLKEQMENSIALNLKG
jgi:cannibalism toxin, SdpC family